MNNMIPNNLLSNFVLNTKGAIPRPSPHPRTIFSLVPLNAKAEAVLNHPNNREFVSAVPHPDEAGETTLGLGVGFHIGSQSGHTLATIGRTGNIEVDDETISRTQCSFEMHETSKAIMLYDRSSFQSTQVFGKCVIPFESSRPTRRVVVSKEINLLLGFGGPSCNIFQFRLVWHACETEAMEFPEDREDNPRWARTLDPVPDVSLAQRLTEIPVPGKQGPRIRYQEQKNVGAGSFGRVFKILNLDTGDYLAVKKIYGYNLGDETRRLLKREVEVMSRVVHEHIVEYIGSQGWGEKEFEIFMRLKEGNICKLIKMKDIFVHNRLVAEALFKQMLQALDCLANAGIIHRDLKPENILFTTLSNGEYKFQLTDFGLANIVANARTIQVGTPIYMAPELLTKQEIQTPKIDVWSLFVTLAYAMNGAGFRKKPLNSHQQVKDAINAAANHKIFSQLKASHMVEIDPKLRASAGFLLDKFYNGEGRMTPRRRMKRIVGEEPLIKARSVLNTVQHDAPRIDGQPPAKRQKPSSIQDMDITIAFPRTHPMLTSTGLPEREARISELP
ncbi:hypothetical protein FQN57_005837 [Myotisia sp. PD_48]|nr:hypothetical protein FQN57_005837 [Myotisia sp. PD_48]